MKSILLNEINDWFLIDGLLQSFCIRLDDNTAHWLMMCSRRRMVLTSGPCYYLNRIHPFRKHKIELRSKCCPGCCSFPAHTRGRLNFTLGFGWFLPGCPPARLSEVGTLVDLLLYRGQENFMVERWRWLPNGCAEATLNEYFVWRSRRRRPRQKAQMFPPLTIIIIF